MNPDCLVYYNSREKRCKKPYGALRDDRKLTLSLSISRRMAPRSVVLCICREGEEAICCELRWKSFSNGRDVYSVMLDPLEKGLYTYYFKLETAVSNALYGASLPEKGGEGILCYDSCIPYYLTVYDHTAKVPSWYGDGVTYQIFPDRFCKEGVSSLPEGRRLVTDPLKIPQKYVSENGDVDNTYFYGGNIQGIISKLPYLYDLGVTTIYINPIFLSHSNHRYDTADYLQIDPLLGDLEDFRELCRKAGQYKIRIILDGVFNHTGNDSIYFNQLGTYPGKGAYQGEESPYYPWFTFTEFPQHYECWWGVKILPSVNENAPSFRRFIYQDKNSVVRYWLRQGASGWRLDVADELPDDFISGIHKAAREEKEDAVVIGEVWEDASLKVAYGQRRKYLLGNELDGVMNYPFRNAVLAYLLDENAEVLRDVFETISENYPYENARSLMNLLGTHDTQRILTVLGKDTYPKTLKEKETYRLPKEKREKAIKRLKMAAMLLFTHLGSPTVYYGDEGGMQGLDDPYNRAWFCVEEEALPQYFRRLGRIRRDNPIFSHRHASFIEANGARLHLSWGRKIALLANAGEKEEHFLLKQPARELCTGQTYPKGILTMRPLQAMLFHYEERNGGE